VFVGRAAWCVILGLSLCPQLGRAILIRDDVPDSKYLVKPSEFPALADLPDEGHGVLIADRWVVTAAHAVTGRPIPEASVNGNTYAVAKLIVNPGYKKAPSELEKGDAAPLMAFMSESDDIALIELTNVVKGVMPAPMYRRSDEAGKIAEIFGRGATGNGLVGKLPNSPHRGELRRAYSRVTSADGRWITLTFETAPRALPLEGSPTDGDSGGAVLIEVDHVWELAGLVSHKFSSGKVSTFQFGRYGQITYQTRISHYVSWIETTMRANQR
jgi:Trypsin